MSLRNRTHNSQNPFQGNFKKVLCVCSAGLLRSPTAAFVLSQEPFNYNTRACGIVPDYALIPIDEVHLAWADSVVCMTKDQELQLRNQLDSMVDVFNYKNKPTIICLEIEDSYGYRDPELIKLIVEKYKASAL